MTGPVRFYTPLSNPQVRGVHLNDHFGSWRSRYSFIRVYRRTRARSADDSKRETVIVFPALMISERQVVWTCSPRYLPMSSPAAQSAEHSEHVPSYLAFTEPHFRMVEGPMPGAFFIFPRSPYRGAPTTLNA
jgi:hypothetical protein